MKRYWKEILFFGVYLAILLYCRSSDITMKCAGNDSMSFLYGARFLESLYPSPLYTLLGYPIANLPFGIDGGNLVLFLSTIPAWLSCILIFLSLRRMSDNKMAPWIGASMIAGSYVYFSQAVIIEVYIFMSFLFSLSFFLMVYQKYSWSNVVMGLAMCTHYVSCFVPFIAFVIWNKEFRRRWYWTVIVWIAVSVLYYSFVDIFYWNPSSPLYLSFYSTAIFMIYQTSRGFDSMHGLVIVSMFGLSLIPILLFAKDIKKSGPFLFLLLVPVVYFLTNMNDYTFGQFVPSIPYYAVMAGLGASQIKTKYLDKVILISSLLMMMSLPLVFNMNKIDASPTTARSAINELDKAEDGSIIVCVRLFSREDGVASDTIGGTVAATVEYYNRTENKHLIPFHIWLLDEKESIAKSAMKEKMIKYGVNAPEGFSTVMENGESVWASEKRRFDKLLLSIADSNPNKSVYYYRIVDEKKEKSELTKVQR